MVKEVFSVFLILFSVIDIMGSIPVIVEIQSKADVWQPFKITLVSGLFFVLYLFVGEQILLAFGVDASSFAVAGGMILFLLGIEMLLGIELFKHDQLQQLSVPVVPLAFPLIAGAGSMTTLISLGAAYSREVILMGIALNLFLVWIVLENTKRIHQLIGVTGLIVLRKFFGTILLAMAIKLIKENWASIGILPKL